MIIFLCSALFNGATPQCVAKGSIAAGQYCSNSDVCQSGRCDGNYCASGSPQYCDSDNQCAETQVCTCNGYGLNSGIGSCTNNACFGALQVASHLIPFTSAILSHPVPFSHSFTLTNNTKGLISCLDQNCFPCAVASCAFHGHIPAGDSSLCQVKFCKSQADAYWQCAGANQLAVSLLFTTLFAFFAAHFSKKF